MKDLSVLIKPVSSSCNLRCKYCFYFDESVKRNIANYGKMSASTVNKMIDNLFLEIKSGDSITFAFQGGEPTLAGLSFYEEFVKYVETKDVEDVKVYYSLQTNGILIDKKWCRFLKDRNFLVGLSLDCIKEINDTFRVTSEGKGTFKKIMDTKKLLEKFGIEYNILCVLTDELSKIPQEVFNFILKENIHYIQFIPCLDEFDEKNYSEYSLHPENFASFYKVLFLLWKKEWEKGNYISIDFIDNLISLLSTGKSSNCGFTGRCSCQYVIEASGEVFPCDFYVFDKYCSGNITENKLSEVFYNKSMQNFLVEDRPISTYCKNCEILKICNGGCKRQKYNMYLNREENYCGYKDFIFSCQEEISEVIKYL